MAILFHKHNNSSHSYKRRNVLLFIGLLWSFFSVNGQISHVGGLTPWNTDLNDNIPKTVVAATNIDQCKQEDLVTDQHKDIAWRFGVELPVSANLDNSGVWEVLDNGDRLWRLALGSPGALSINLNFDRFHLPEGVQFFVYTQTDTLGAFTALNNKKDSAFSTTLLKGSTVTLAYHEPVGVTERGVVQLKSMVHGYRELSGASTVFGASGGCNVNSICDSTDWGNQARSVVMLLTAGNTRICSGALINNVRQDGKPYVLSANHCPLASNGVVMFNYESTACDMNNDGITNQTISGYTIVARDNISDFALIELSSAPPANYNVFYSGWSAEGDTPFSGTGIHHPKGDVKKISHDYDPLVSSGYYGAGNDHWQVVDWDQGTTENVSSGSPLFDHNRRIVGQLHGGNARCGTNEYDYYGKFSVSWDSIATTSKQLKHWLDPDNTGTLVLDGFDPNGSVYDRDASVINVLGIASYVCGDSAAPMVTIKNNGNEVLTSLTLNYSVDGVLPGSYNWVGNLSTYETALIELPMTNFSGGTHSLEVYSASPNGQSDQNNWNDTIIIDFRSNDAPYLTTLQLTVDDWGTELSWVIKDSLNNVVEYLEAGTYPDNASGQTYTKELCLAEGCFTLVLSDTEGDGYCCSEGNGALILTDNISSDTIVQDNTFDGDSILLQFCLEDTCNLVISGDVTHVTAIGASDGGVDVNVTNGSGNYQYAWSNSTNFQNLSNVSVGSYTLIVTDVETGCTKSKVFVVDNVNSVNAIKSASGFSIFPNPASDRVFIDFKRKPLLPVRVWVSDVAGRLLSSHQVSDTHNTLFLENSDPGVYFISVWLEGRREIQRLIVR